MRFFKLVPGWLPPSRPPVSGAKRDTTLPMSHIGQHALGHGATDSRPEEPVCDRLTEGPLCRNGNGSFGP